MADRERLGVEEEKIYIPKNKALRIEIIQLYYNVLVAEYRRGWETMKLVTRNYWWPGVTRNIRKYVDKYDMCQRMKNRTEAPVGKLKLSEIPEKL